ncbi:MAG TPA: glycosyltransferase family 39 protein, partial [Candidatus Binataceae bacterium]|nr:glycosyltransferase family 39 protein [Candidatus Binataceae bacterium]
MRQIASTLMLLALIVGAVLRFYDLGALQMSADEGATWAAAGAPSISDVIAIQQTHNAGKLPLHDLLLHGWISVFGDSIVAMRSLSALCGVITIALMFLLTREIFRIRAANTPPADTAIDVDLVAALSALLCAVSLVTIKYERELRMYGLLLALAVVHLWAFLRALRIQSIFNWILVALLTSALVAVNMVTTSMLAVEGIWLMMILLDGQIDYRDRTRAVVISGLAIVAGVAILAPILYVPFLIGREVVASGKMEWLTAPAWWEPFAFFNKAVGSVAFPILLGLAAWGAWRARRDARPALGFVLLVMWAPPILLVIGSYIWRPMFLERYALYSFPAFFILIALGIWELGNNSARLAAIIIVVSLAFGHIHSYFRKTHDIDWREAA